ncbi:MAG: hypothetical protein GF398_07215 [Chitinivibrionales bacterium]|nr:hypothetical protein [Chitinivibrionales bacterium]
MEKRVNFKQLSIVVSILIFCCILVLFCTNPQNPTDDPSYADAEIALDIKTQTEGDAISYKFEVLLPQHIDSIVILVKDSVSGTDQKRVVHSNVDETMNGELLLSNPGTKLFEIEVFLTNGMIKKHSARVVITPIPDIMPPAITLVSPSTDSIGTSACSLSLRLQVTDSSGVAEVTITSGNDTITLIRGTQDYFSTVLHDPLTELQTYRVKAVDSAIAGNRAEQDLKIAWNGGKPQAPAGLDASFRSEDSLSLTWPAAELADYYLLKWRPAHDSSFDTSVSCDTTVFPLDSLEANTAYLITVNAVNCFGRSDSVAQLTVRTRPSTPRDLAATAPTCSTASLSWSAVGGALRYNIYQVVDANDSMQLIDSSASAGRTIGMLNNSTSYAFRIIAITSIGDISQPSEAVSATTPACQAVSPLLGAPEGVVASTVSSSEIQIIWRAIDGSAGYIIYRSISETGSYDSVASSGDTTHTVGGLGADSIYYFKVRAHDTTGALSDFSSFDSARTLPLPPEKPVIDTIYPLSSSSVFIDWDTAFRAEQYILLRASSADGTFNPIDSTSLLSITDANGLSAGTQFIYKIKAVNAGGSSESDICSTTTDDPPLQAPSAPTGVSATARFHDSILISWNRASLAEAYVVLQALTADGPFDSAALTADSFCVKGDLYAGNTYFYAVIARNSAGDSDTSDVDSATTLVAPPSAPATVSATSLSDSSIRINWSAANEAEGYKLIRAGASGSWDTVHTAATTVQEYTNTGLSASTKYRYQVVAYNAGGTALSAICSTFTRPEKPSGLSAEALSASSVRLSWSANAGADRYIIYRLNSGTYDYIAEVTGTVTGYTNTGLLANTDYSYTVAAANEGGVSAQSDPASAITWVSAPGTPSIAAISSPSSSSISLFWQSVTADSIVVLYGTSQSAITSRLARVGGTDTTITGLNSGTTYWCKVTAYNISGIAADSASVITRPAVPTGLTATAQSTCAIELSWSAAVGAAQYYLYQATSATGPYSLFDSTTSNTYTHNGLSASQSWYYKVEAANASGLSGQSSEATATTDALPVVAITSPSDNGATSQNTITVTWTVNGATQIDQTSETLANEGANTITRSHTDACGNTVSASITVNRDTQAPVITISEPGNSHVTSNSSVTVSFTADGTDLDTLVQLSEGRNDLTIRALDSVGNEGTAALTVYHRPNIIFVKQGVSNGDGTSWATAFDNLQPAIDVSDAAKRIWVAAGTYKPGTQQASAYTFDAPSQVSGGFAGTETDSSQRDREANVTTLDDQLAQFVNSDTLIRVHNSVRIDGFNIINKLNTAVYIHTDVDLRMSNCNFEVDGGHYYITSRPNSSMIFDDCAFEGAGYVGRVIMDSAGYLELNACTFTNIEAQYGIRIYKPGSKANIKRCVFYNNLNDAGWIRAVHADYVHIFSSVFMENDPVQGAYWSGVTIRGSAAEFVLERNTFYNNGEYCINVGPSYLHTDSLLRIEKSIFWLDRSPTNDGMTQIIKSTFENMYLSYCVIKNGTTNLDIPSLPIGHISIISDTEPLFKRTESGGTPVFNRTPNDFLALQESRNLGGGTPTYLSDITGYAGPTAGAYDAGAYEYR